MARSNASSVSQYLRELPADRRQVVSAMRQHILENLPSGYEEAMNWGMITYQVPLARHPNTYNGQPLAYAALAAQKDYFAVYLMGAYDPVHRKQLRDAFRQAGKKLDMGKSCLRFRALEDLPLEAIGRIIASTPPDAFIATVENSRRTGARDRSKKRSRSAGKSLS